METKNLYNQIVNEFKVENYKEVVKLFKKYTHDSESGIDAYLVFIYSEALVKLSLNYEAIRNLKVLYKLNSTTKNKYNLAITYLSISDYSNALKLFYELLKEEPLNYRMYFYIAKIYMLIGNYKIAKEILLNKRFYFDEQTQEEASRILASIDKHFIFDSFIQMDYNYFKENDNKLCNGHVVTLKDHSKYINEIEDQSINNRKPYLIWKSEKNIYGFLIDSINTHDITSNDITNTFIKIDEKDISLVLDEVNYKTYNKIVDDVYKRIFYYGSSETKSKFAPFIQGMKENINLDEKDIIAFKGINNTFKYYYIIKINDNNTYKAIEVTTDNNHTFNLESESPVTIKKDRNIFKVIKIDNLEKKKIYTQIPECFTLDNLEGKIVKKDEQEIIILLKNNNEYIGIDRIFSNSFMNVNVIEENTYVEVIDSLDKDEYIEILKLFYEKNIETPRISKGKVKLKQIENKIEEEQSYDE